MRIGHRRIAARIGVVFATLTLVGSVGCTGGSRPAGAPSGAATGGSQVTAGTSVTTGSPVTAELPGIAVEIQGFDHIEKGAPHPPYNSTPPTSGPHWSILNEAPVPWGIYKVPIADEAQVHNLEHGGVMIQYNCADCPDLVAQLEGFYNRYTAGHRLSRYPQSTKLVVAPYPNMRPRIALTAWGRIDGLDAFDEERVTRFVDTYRDNGPEAVP